jgi:hypothetical protein
LLLYLFPSVFGHPTLDPDWIPDWIPDSDSLYMLDPDPYPDPDSMNPDPQLCQKLQKLDDFRILVKNGNYYKVAVGLPWSSWVWRRTKPAAAAVLLAQLFSPRTRHALGRPLPP